MKYKELIHLLLYRFGAGRPRTAEFTCEGVIALFRQQQPHTPYERIRQHVKTDLYRLYKMGLLTRKRGKRRPRRRGRPPYVYSFTEKGLDYVAWCHGDTLKDVQKCPICEVPIDVSGLRRGQRFRCPSCSTEVKKNPREVFKVPYPSPLKLPSKEQDYTDESRMWDLNIIGSLAQYIVNNVSNPDAVNAAGNVWVREMMKYYGKRSKAIDLVTAASVAKLNTPPMIYIWERRPMLGKDGQPIMDEGKALYEERLVPQVLIWDRQLQTHVWKKLG